MVKSTAKMGYELLDHTGDLGIRVWAEDVKGIFHEAARALFAIITDLEKVTVRVKRKIMVEAATIDELLVAWLSELLYLYEVEGLLFCDFAFTEIGEKSVTGIAMGEEFDEGRHAIRTSIKAVTYHQLEMKEKDGRWHAQVIFDI
jgi:SHS2 domain-containing protein